MVSQGNTKELSFGDTFRVNDLSDGDNFKLSFECGEFFGPQDVRVKIVEGTNRLQIEGKKEHSSEGVSVSRQLNYVHELPDGVDVCQLRAEWDPNDECLVVWAPFE